MPANVQRITNVQPPPLFVIKQKVEKSKLFQADILTSTEHLTHEEWLAWRNKGIGGSDASVVCGINKYKSPVELWLEKTNQIEHSEAGEAAYWGTVMEPIIRTEFEKRTGLKVDIVKYLLQHPKHKFMLANLDGVICHPEYGNCIFEAKTASAYKDSEWKDDIPQEYHLQIQHYIAVTGLNFTFVSQFYKYSF
jgi:putative phage-type endonuclease